MFKNDWATRDFHQIGEVISGRILSYSSKDKRAKEAFQDNLTVMMDDNIIAQWHDGIIEQGRRLEKDIEELARWDVVVGLFTTAFHASGFIKTLERQAAKDNPINPGDGFLFILIIVGKNVNLPKPKLANFKIIKPEGKAVRAYPLNEGFNKVAQELEPLLLARQELKKQQHPEEPRVDLLHSRFTRVQEKESITLIVHGDYIQGRKTMNDNNSIHIGNNVNSHNVNSQVGQMLTNCTNTIQQQAPSDRKDLLEELQKQVAQLIKALPADKQDEAPQIVENLEMVVKQVTSAKPQRKWYSLSAEGLMEAATYVKDFGGNIAGALQNLENLTWP